MKLSESYSCSVWHGECMLRMTLSALTHAWVLTFAATPSVSQVNSFDSIFTEALRAMGGEAELRKIKSITALANCVGPRGKYTTEIQSARNRLLFKQVSAGN